MIKSTNFQHSEQQILRKQSETQVLDACKLSMVVDLAKEVLYLSQLKHP